MDEGIGEMTMGTKPTSNSGLWTLVEWPFYRGMPMGDPFIFSLAMWQLIRKNANKMIHLCL